MKPPSIRSRLLQAKDLLQHWKEMKDEFGHYAMAKEFTEMEKVSNSIIYAVTQLHALFHVESNDDVEGADWRKNPWISQRVATLYKQKERLKTAVKELDVKKYILTLDYCDRTIAAILRNALKIMKGGFEGKGCDEYMRSVSLKRALEAQSNADKVKNWKEWLKDYERKEGVDGLFSSPRSLDEMSFQDLTALFKRELEKLK